MTGVGSKRNLDGHRIGKTVCCRPQDLLLWPSLDFAARCPWKTNNWPPTWQVPLCKLLQEPRRIAQSCIETALHMLAVTPTHWYHGACKTWTVTHSLIISKFQFAGIHHLARIPSAGSCVAREAMYASWFTRHMHAPSSEEQWSGAKQSEKANAVASRPTITLPSPTKNIL